MEDTILKIETSEPLSTCIPLADWIDFDRVDAVDTILDQGDTAVYKVPRAGFPHLCDHCCSKARAQDIDRVTDQKHCLLDGSG